MLEELLAIGTFVAQAVWSVWPMFLISMGLSVLVRALKLDGTIRQAFQARVGLAILGAALLGAFSPLCSCTVVPVISGLLLSGVPLAPVMAFWIASPTIDPEIFALTVGTLGWPLALARLGATLALSLGAGYLTLALTRSGFLRGGVLRRQAAAKVVPRSTKPRVAYQARLLADAPLAPAVAAAGAAPLTLLSYPAGGVAQGTSATLPLPVRADPWWTPVAARLRSLDWQAMGRDFVAQSWSLGRWLILAFVLEALITRYVPQAAIAGLLGGDSLLAVPLAALIGIPLYLNNVSALPIVAGLLAQGMQPGAAIAFLIAGPVTTVPAMTAVWNVVSRRVFALYLGFGLGGALILGLLTNLILGAF
jgi:uncharacterized membrane protein YraQ (UPF0718 family)